MSALATSIRPPLPLIIGVIGGALLSVWGTVAPRGVLQGWLVAFVILGGLPLGALALLCVARLTGGRWALAASPLLLRTVAATPLLCLAFLPVLVGAGLIFPWASNEGAVAANDVARWYLNTEFFALRGFAALLGLSAISVLLLLRRGGRLLAGVGLVFYAIAVDFTSTDWVLSLSPRSSSSAFGAEMAVQQVLSAFALTLVLPGSRRGDISRDIAGLTLAAALGLLYLATMSLIVNWYGDQPDRAGWYLARSEGVWLLGALGALFFCAIAPIAALLFAGVRRSPDALRLVGASILLGVALHDVWLIAPSAAPMAPLAALLALATISWPASAFSSWLRMRLPEREHRDDH